MPFAMEIVEYDWSKHTVTKEKIPPRPGEDGPPTSEFQTYHAIYALAKAGVGIDDARLRKAVDFCLAQQTASGAWQGSPEYKNFDTPFRDTQYAIMALSQLFPGPKGVGGAKGWNAGFAAPPGKFDSQDVAATINALDQHWDRPPDDTVAAIRGLPDSEHAGRFRGGRQCFAMLDRFRGWLNGLGTAARSFNGRRLVAAANRLAQVEAGGVRGGGSAGDGSSDARTRWGGRGFSISISSTFRRVEAVIELARMACTPVPAADASTGLYQWWFWI
jgi:hypothetical protein